MPKAAKNLPIITFAITTTIILCQKYYKFGTQTCIKVRKYQKHFLPSVLQIIKSSENFHEKNICAKKEKKSREN